MVTITVGIKEHRGKSSGVVWQLALNDTGKNEWKMGRTSWEVTTGTEIRYPSAMGHWTRDGRDWTDSDRTFLIQLREMEW